MDGEILVERLLGTSIAIDPGDHTFTFETPGQPPVRKQLLIRQNEKDRRERITLAATSASSPSTAALPPPRSSDTTSVSSSPSLGTQKLLAIVSGGVGVVGVALGTIFGLDAKSKRDDARKICPDQCTDQSGVDAWSSAKSAGNLSTVAFAVGALGLAGGAVLWFTAQPESPPGGALSARVGVGPGVISVSGRW